MCECTSIACNMALSGHNAHISLSKSVGMWLGRWATGQNGIVNVNIFMARSFSLLLLCWIQYLHRKWQKTRKKQQQRRRRRQQKAHSEEKKNDVRPGSRVRCTIVENARMGSVVCGYAAAVAVVRSFAIFYLFLWLSCQNMSTDF